MKSLGGIRLNNAKVLEKGLQFDRRWMLVDEKGIFMTQRIHHKMALFKLAMHEQQLIVTFKQNEASVNHPSIKINTSIPSKGELFEAVVWDDKVTTIEVDSEISAWFSKHLELPCRLVNFPENNPRPVDPLYKVNDENVSLADSYPYLIIGQSSLDDLNARLEQALPMNRFRPNFVFSGGEPFEEDDWKNISIGDNKFIGVKPCSRCVLTTVNQENGERGMEPLRTLATYRKRDNKIYFGQNLVAVDNKVIQVGDRIVKY